MKVCTDINVLYTHVGIARASRLQMTQIESVGRTEDELLMWAVIHVAPS